MPPTRTTTPLSRSLTRWMRDEGLTQREAAERIGVSRRALQNYLLGTTRNPRAPHLQKLMRSTGLALEDLIGEADEQVENAGRRISSDVAKLNGEIEELRQKLAQNEEREARVRQLLDEARADLG